MIVVLYVGTYAPVLKKVSRSGAKSGDHRKSNSYAHTYGWASVEPYSRSLSGSNDEYEWAWPNSWSGMQIDELTVCRSSSEARFGEEEDPR